MSVSGRRSARYGTDMLGASLSFLSFHIRIVYFSSVATIYSKNSMPPLRGGKKKRKERRRTFPGARGWSRKGPRNLPLWHEIILIAMKKISPKWPRNEGNYSFELRRNVYQPFRDCGNNDANIAREGRKKTSRRNTKIFSSFLGKINSREPKVKLTVTS